MKYETSNPFAVETATATPPLPLISHWTVETKERKQKMNWRFFAFSNINVYSYKSVGSSDWQS